MRWFRKAAAPSESAADKADGEVRLSTLLAPNAIQVNLESTDKDEVFEEMVNLLVQSGSITDREAALEAIRRREALGSTGIGNGVALPHGKHESISRLVAALGVSRQGIDFGGPDGKPAKVVIMLLARTDNPGPHIQALAQIAQLVQSETFMNHVMEARSSAQVLDLIRAEE